MTPGRAPMDPLRGILLAVVLLDVAVGARDGGCGDAGPAAFCTATVAEEGDDLIYCGNEISIKPAGTTPDNARIGSLTNTGCVQNNSESGAVEFIVDGINITLGGGNERLYEREFTITCMRKKQTNGKHNDTDSEQTPKENQLSTQRFLNTTGGSNMKPNISPIIVNVFGYTINLDLSPFHNVNTVQISLLNFSFVKICSNINITKLSITNSNMKKAPIFLPLQTLNRLNLSHNIIEKIPLDVMPPSVRYLDLSYNLISLNENLNLPASLEMLNLSYNELSHANLRIRGNLSVFILKGNGLLYVPVIGMIYLEELDLSENHLHVLHVDVFEEVPSLTRLNMRSNDLVSLEEEVFKRLRKLQELDISENRIKYLTPTTLQYLNNLVILRISGNSDFGHFQFSNDASLLLGTSKRLRTIEAAHVNLTRIPSTLTRSVRNVYLSGNYISSIQCGELDSFPLLQIMDVSSNNISSVEEDALGRLDFLTRFILFDNRLTSIPKSLPAELTYFDMRCNSLEKLTQYDFVGMPKLRVLLLSRNKISVIEDESFGLLSSLEVLDLSHNPIKILSRLSFLGPRRLKEMYLVSLTDLKPSTDPLSFPAPESARLEVLNIESSPVLANQLMDDVAALRMFHELYELNLNHCRLSMLPNDLPKYLPRLQKLKLTGNIMNCINIIWLVKWLQTMDDPLLHRKYIYSPEDTCCKGINCTTDGGKENAVCASPSYLSGKEIISLEEGSFPDSKRTTFGLPTSPPNQIAGHHIKDNSVNSRSGQSSVRTLSTGKSYDKTSGYVLSNVTVTITPVLENGTSELILNMITNKMSSTNLTNNSKITPPIKSSPVVKQYQQRDYSETDNRSGESLQTTMLGFNESGRNTEDTDNHINDSLHLGALLSPTRPGLSHPSMVLFLIVLSALLMAAAATLYSQSRPKDYRLHRDIEVSSLGGVDLW